MANTIRTIKAYWSIHIKTAMEYRINFLFQSGFMIINNVLFLLALFVLFNAYGIVRGYDYYDAAMLFGVAAFAYGIVIVFLGGLRDMHEDIQDGKFDYYLTTPVNTLLHRAISSTNDDGWGDLVLGVTVLVWLAPNLFVAIIIGLLSAVIIASAFIALNSIAFFLEKPSKLITALMQTVIGFSSWPINAYHPPIRLALYITLFAFIATVPASIITSFSWSNFGILSLVSALTLIGSVLIYSAGVRHYESGNLVTMRG